MEVGVRNWGFGRFYKEKFGKVYGVDVEDYSARHPGVEFALVESDGSIPLDDSSVDIAVSHSVLEHVEDLDKTLREIDRILRPKGWLYLTVCPLYYSSYGAHLNRDGRRLENWEHLNASSEHFLTRNPLPTHKTSGHDLNMLTSSMFLSAVAKQPWQIVNYKLSFETKEIPGYVDGSQCSSLELAAKGFRFVGRKAVEIELQNVYGEAAAD